VVAVPTFWFAANLVRRPVGRALIAIRDDETSAKTMGVNLASFKTRTFGLSAAYAGVAGSLFVFNNGFVAPESFSLVVSFSFLAAIVVGGLATVAGALFGALFIVFVPVWSSDVNDALSGVIYGAALIACMYVFRSGMMGLLRSAFARVVEVEGSTKGRDDDGVEEVADAGADRRAGAGAGGVRS
jgi:branched-chain amino acid transport system permease protein